MSLQTPIEATTHFLHAVFLLRDVEAATACLADGFVWFGRDDVETALGIASARTALRASVAALPETCEISFPGLTQTMLTPDCGTVLGMVRSAASAQGGGFSARLAATCVRQDGGFLLSMLHLALPAAEKSESDTARMEARLQEFNNVFFDASMLVGWLRCDTTSRFSIRYMNGYFASLLGYESRESLLAACDGSYAALMRADDAAEFSAASAALPVGGSVAFTYRLRVKSGGEVWVSERCHKYHGTDGTPLLLCLCLDVSDVVQMEQSLAQQQAALKFTRSELNTLMDGIPGGIYRSRFSDKLRVDFVNAGFTKMTGYTLKDIQLGFEGSYSRLLVEEDRESFLSAVHALSAAPGSRALSYRIRRKDGDVIWVSDSLYSTRLADGRMWAFGVTADITASRASYTRLKLLTDSIPGGLASYEYSPDGLRLLYHSDGFFSLFGYSGNEVRREARKDPFHRVFAEDIPLLQTQISNLIHNNTPMHCKYRVHTKDGGSRWLSLRGSASERCGDTAILNTVLFDVTDQHAAEETLRIRDEEYRLAIRHSGKLVYRYTVADHAIDISPEAAALFGHPPRVANVPESIIAAGTVAQDSIEALRDFYRRIDRGERTGSMEACRRIFDGTEHWFSARFSTIFSDSGKPVTAIILLEDITDAREADIVGSLDRERLMVALRSVYPVSLSANLTQGTYRMLCGNESFTSLDAATGTIDALVSGGTIRMLPEYAEEFARRFNANALRARFASGASSERMEYRQRSFDGKLHWLECVAFHADNPYGNDILGIILLRFIDEQKTTEEALKAALESTSNELSNELWYQKIVDSSVPIGTVLYRLDGEEALLHVGGTMLQELGYTREEFAAFQKQQFRGFVFEPDYGTLFHGMRLDGATVPTSYEQEFRVIRKDGTPVWMYEKGTLVEADGGVPAYISVWMDITRRKEMEEKLRINEEEMHLAMAQVGKMVCIYDVAKCTLTMPEEYARMHGVPPMLENVPESMAAAGLHSAPGERSFAEFFRDILGGKKTGSMETYAVLPDGSECWERAESVTIFSGDGRPVKAVIAIEDTTVAHQKEHEATLLRENERLFRLVAAHSSRLIFRYDVATRTAYADNATTLQGAPLVSDTDIPDGILARGGVLPESLGDYQAFFASIDADQPTGDAKLHMLAPDGTPRWVDMRYSVVDHSPDGRPKSAVLSFSDVTDAHEKELAYARYQQRVSEDAANDTIVYFDTDLTSNVVEKQGGNIPHLVFPEIGCSHEDAVNYGIHALLDPADGKKAHAFFARERLFAQFSGGVHTMTEDFRAILPTNTRRWFRADVQLIEDPYSSHIKAYTELRDVTEEKLAELTVKKQAETDGLTGIYNKVTAEALIRGRLSATDGALCALMIVDLDGLKSINDNLGHAEGDRAIRLMAQTLKKHFRQTDIVGRFGGDEFIAFLDGAGSEAKLRSILTALMRKLSSMRIGKSDDVPLHGSIGVAIGACGAEPFDKLFQNADRALYHVKRNGKNDYAIYTPEMEQAAYQYKPHDGSSLWMADSFDHAELDRLLYAVSTIYPLVISVNLTKNSYYMMQYNHFTTTAYSDVGIFDELISSGVSTFAPDDRAAFLSALSRENLLAAHARGQALVSHTGLQRGDDGVYRRIRTDVIFARSGGDGDVLEITLAREVEGGSNA